MKSKKVFSVILSILLSVVLSVFVGSAVAFGLDSATASVSPFVPSAILFGLSFLPITPHGSLCAYVALNVLKPGENAGLGQNHKDKIIIFSWDDVESGWARDDKGIVMSGPLVFKAGCHAIEVYGTLSTVGMTSDSEGDPDSKGIKQSVKFSHPGNKTEIREFRTNWLNKNIGIVDRKCNADAPDLYGSPCNPLQLNFKAKNDKDGNAAEMEFTSIGRGPDVAIYNQTITLETPVATIAADATTLAISAEGQYQLTDGSAAVVEILTVVAPVHDRVFTLLGASGSYPSEIKTTGEFILKDGSTWSAIDGAQISFRTYKVGASTYKHIEIARS